MEGTHLHNNSSGREKVVKTHAGWCVSLISSLIRIYQKSLSGQIRSRRCRFNPTCSQFALDALSKYGLVKGITLSMRRIARCNPGSAGGDDPVP
ncbi:MAG: membrane protein insertion efficiency factor YidD [Haliscomenobacteraceae bacterium CHB4]|nr:membrane protein insertion efficiency factor YidD [Haliscomenobacteraceae bacterium CHB4]